MKKYLKLFILLLIIPILNVNALSKGDKVKITKVTKTYSTSMSWTWSDKSTQKMQIFTYKLGNKYNSYCINAHLNDVKLGSTLMVETTIGNGEEDDTFKGPHYGYYKIFQLYNGGKDNYSKAEFISALRIYSMINHIYSSTGVLSSKNIESLNYKTRKIMYYEYANFANKVIDNVDFGLGVGVGVDKLKFASDETYQLKITGTNTFNDTVKLVQEAITASTNYKKMSSKSHIASNPKVEFGTPKLNDDKNVAIYPITLTGFSNDGNFTISSIDGTSSYTLKDKDGKEVTGTYKYSEGENLTIEIPVDDTNKDKICKGNVKVNYIIEDPNAYSGAIFCSPDKNNNCINTRQRFIYLDDNTKNEQTNNLAKIEEACEDTPGDAPVDPPENTPPEECDRTVLTDEEYYCCMHPKECKPENDCDETQFNCDPNTCDEDINTTKIKTSCDNNSNDTTVTLEYEEGASGVSECVLNKNYNNKYEVTPVNSYCSIICKEGYTFKAPTKLITSAGRSFKIDMSLTKASQECYFTTAKQQYMYDYITTNKEMISLYNEYNEIDDCNNIDVEVGEEEDAIEKQAEAKLECENQRKALQADIKKQLDKLNVNLEDYNKEFSKCEYAVIKFKKIGKKSDDSTEWTINSTIEYSYGEPQKENDPSKKYSSMAGANAAYENTNAIEYNTKAYYFAGNVTNFEKNQEVLNKTQRHYYKCDTTNADSIKCYYETATTSDPYAYWSKYLKEGTTVEYKTKRVYYTHAGTGNITVSTSKPDSKKYSLVNGLPVAYDTNPGKYNYSITVNNLGTEGRFSNKLKKYDSKDYTKYQCTYSVDEEARPNDTPNYCIKDESSNFGTEYLCTSSVYFDIKKTIASGGTYNWSNLASSCKLITEDEKKACISNRYNYNCDTGGYGRKCTSTVFNEYQPNTTNTTSNKKIYDITYRTITNNNIFPSSKSGTSTRTIGFNWDVNSINSLSARKAVDTMNYIAYRSHALYESAGGTSSELVSPELIKLDEINTTITVTLDSELMKYLKNLDITNDTLNCYDYILEAVNETQCEEKAYTWVDNKCKAENIFCYSDVINDIVSNYRNNIETGTRPNNDEFRKQDDLKSNNFSKDIYYEDIKNLNKLDYAPVDEGTTTTAIGTDYYHITSSEEVSDYWTVYDFVTLDVDGDGNADIGPSWK